MDFWVNMEALRQFNEFGIATRRNGRPTRRTAVHNKLLLLGVARSFGKLHTLVILALAQGGRCLWSELVRVTD